MIYFIKKYELNKMDDSPPINTNIYPCCGHMPCVCFTAEEKNKIRHRFDRLKRKGYGHSHINQFSEYASFEPCEFCSSCGEHQCDDYSIQFSNRNVSKPKFRQKYHTGVSARYRVNSKKDNRRPVIKRKAQSKIHKAQTYDRLRKYYLI